MTLSDTQRVVSFAEARAEDVHLLGGKGASLVEMHGMGMNVPPGFILSTEVCREFLVTNSLEASIETQMEHQITSLQGTLNRSFGDASAPLLVSVRSGAPVSMPGMMDTVLNLGLNDDTVQGLASMTGDPRFAQDCYARLLRSYGTTVLGLEDTGFQALQDETDTQDLAQLQRLTRSYLELIDSRTGRPFPQNPRVQLLRAIEAVFRSWDGKRAKSYRRYAGIDDKLGSAVVVQAMVFGNLGADSGTGVAFTRDPATGRQEAYADFLANAQGEDIVSGEHDVQSIDHCREVAPEAYRELQGALTAIEAQRRDMCEVEFTIEHGRLWMLQARVGQRTGKAAVRIALDLLDEGVISPEEAIARLTPAAISQVQDYIFDPQAERTLLGTGTPSCPGVAVGKAVFNSAAAELIAAQGDDVILVRTFTSPSDIGGMIASRGVVTAHGGRTSHAAVVARSMDLPAVCGTASLEISDTSATLGPVSIQEGEEISIDGSSGEIYRGALPIVPSDVDPRLPTLLDYCDAQRRVPILTEGFAADWADGCFEAQGQPVCSEVEYLDTVPADATAIVLDPAASENPKGLVNTAVRMAMESGTGLAIRVTGSWPASVPELPAAPWQHIVAAGDGESVARLLAARMVVKQVTQ